MKDKLMQRAIELALKGKGKTSPNPIVGAVIVKRGKIVGEGYHKKAGKPHAEINALKDAGVEAKGGSMYVTLEPCCHFGKTPPCTQAIIKSGIKKVVIGMKDPNSVVSGKGIRELKLGGMQVMVGLLQNEVEKINEIYIKHITTGLPFLLLKVGMSLDGKIATAKRESKWITSEAARKQVHKLREEMDAVMVGVGTLLEDDPSLVVVKKTKKKDPVRIIVDSHLKTPVTSKVMGGVAGGDTIIVATNRANPKAKKKLEEAGAQVILVPPKNGLVDLTAALKELGAMGVSSIMLEGGSDINFSFLQEGLVDKVLFFIAPKIIGGKKSVGAVGGAGIERLDDFFGIKRMSCSTIGTDLLVEGYC